MTARIVRIDRNRIIRPTQATFAKYFKQQAKRVKEEFLPAVKDEFRESADTLAALLDAILAADNATWESSIASLIVRGVLAGSERTSTSLDLDFALSTERAAEIARIRSGELITGINEVTRDRIRDLITRGIADSNSYDQIARSIRGEFTDFSRRRARNIAVTEIAEAYTRGQLEQGRQIISQGIELECSWSTVGDANVSDGCLENEAAGWIPFGESFPSGDNGPPRFPTCRCALLMQRVQ